jgi:hypothetical protein
VDDVLSYLSGYPMFKSYCNLHIFFYDEFHLGKQEDVVSWVICVRKWLGNNACAAQGTLEKDIIVSLLGEGAKKMIILFKEGSVP